MSETYYIPGVCNIGKNEIRKRYLASLVGFVLVLLITYFLVSFDIFIPVSLVVLFFPFLLAFEGLFQARWKFCAGLASKNKYDFRGTADIKGTVEDEKDHWKDMQTAMRLHVYSVFLSLLFTAIIFGFFYVPALTAITPADNGTITLKLLFNILRAGFSIF